MGQVTKLRLSCYLVLLSFDSKTRLQYSHVFMTLPIFNIPPCHIVIRFSRFINAFMANGFTCAGGLRWSGMCTAFMTHCLSFWWLRNPNTMYLVHKPQFLNIFQACAGKVMWWKGQENVLREHDNVILMAWTIHFSFLIDLFVHVLLIFWQ